MALSAYEIRVIVSAQDHFSSAFSKINNDLRSLSRMQQRAAKDQALLNKELNATQKLRAAALGEAASLRTGKLAEKFNRDRDKAQKAYNKSIERTTALRRQQRSAATSLLAHERNLADIPARKLTLEAKRLRLAETIEKLQSRENVGSNRLLDAAQRDLKATEMRLKNIPRLQEYVNKRINEGTGNVKRFGQAWSGSMRTTAQLKADLAAMDVLQATNLSRADALEQAAHRHGIREAEIERSLAQQAAHMERLSGLERSRQRVQAAGHTGRLMTLAGGIGLAAGAGLANYAADFQRQVALAATQTPGTTGRQGVAVAMKNADRLSTTILQLSKDYGIASEEITKSTYDIFSSIRFSGNVGQQYAAGIDVIKMSAMAAVGGLTDMDTAAKATIILANQFGSSAEQMATNLDTAFAIVKYGNMTFAQFTSMMTKVGSAASRAGYSLQDVAGIMTFLTKKSGKPDEAATWIDRMLQALQTPEFVKGMRLLHVPIDKEGKLKPLSQVMDQILRLGAANKGRGGIGMQNIIPFITSVGKHGFEGGAGLRSTIQAQRGLTFSLQDVKGLKQAQKDVLADHGEFMRSFLAIYNSAGYKWQRLMAGFKVAMLELGTAFLPVMTKIVGYILYFVQIISNASPHTKKLAAYIFAIASAMIFMSGIIVSVTAGFASIYFWLKILNVTSAVTASAGGGWGTLLISMAKFAKVGAIVTGVIAGVVGSVETLNQIKDEKTRGNIFQRVAHRFLLQNKNMMKHIPVVGKLWAKEMDTLLGQDWLVGTTTKKNKNAKKQAKTVQDYFKYIDNLVKKGMSGKGKEQWAKFSKEAEDALNQVLNQTTTPSQAAAAQKQRAQDIIAKQKEILDQASQGLMRMYDEKKQQNESAFGALFSGPISESGAVQWRKQFGIQMNVPELLSDFRAQLKQFQTMRQQITSLRKRGLSADIISDLQARGAEGMPYLKALMEATPKQIREFNSMMGSKKKDITKATEIDFDAQLAKWMKFGATAALQIASGMESEEFAVQKRMNALASRLWSGVAKTLAAQQITLQYGALPGVKGAPPLVTGSGSNAAAGAMTAAQYIANLQSMGYATNNPNLVRPFGPGSAGLGPPGPYGPYNPAQPVQGPGREHKGKFYTEEHTHFHVNGTFYTEEQVMDRALQAASFKKKQSRR